MNVTTYEFNRIEESMEEGRGGKITVEVKIYRNFTTVPRLRSFSFKYPEFIHEEESEDKEELYGCLLGDGVEVEDINSLLMDLILRVNEITSSPTYSMLSNIIFNLSLHLYEVIDNMDVTEEQIIEESFNSAVVVRRPASQDFIDLLQRKTFDSSESSANQKDSSCPICLQEYEEQQSIIIMPCGHIFCDCCIISWLQVNVVCPLCRYIGP
ncbi:PREDICTED: E3 ubiquitin-protein ligase RNF181-like [Camelina sativa]|uniref:E3 ubiquitin-protein ligase RNF181-like n=1 Tax=Camelina sativa TaxID=90675 RepID=A0ABM0TCN7_CAMSA|nr:PREDICTED: E3 ubiquitin-protein ligase RNF181-like [Camelina sativa]